jgi:Predicted integral membrane protein (DUF2269)
VASLYFWLKFLHLAGLGVFLLGHGASAGSSLLLRQPQSDSIRGKLLQLSIRANYFAFPGLLLIIVTGVWMGFLASWWRMGWIWAAIVVLVAVMVVMSAMSVPYHGARDAVRDNKPTTELDSLLKRARPLALAWIGGIGLLVLIFLMVFKPF